MGHDVVVLGSFMMDLSVRAPRRPGPGETVIGSSFEQFLGGKGCNQAIAAARAGAATAMVGRVGDDDFGRLFLARLAGDGIDSTHVVTDTADGTGVGLPLVEATGDNSIVVVPRANGRVSLADVDAAAPMIEAARVLLLQLELPPEVVAAAALRAHEAGVTVVLNPAPAPVDLSSFRGAVDLVVPNEVEAAGLTGATTPRAAAAALRRMLGCDVVVTLGDRGSAVLHGDGWEELAAHPVEALDTVGAGDTYCGSLGARLAAGDHLVAAARYAGAAAALSVTVAGAEPSIPDAAAVGRLLGDPVLSS